MKIAVVGGGVSGLVSASLLSKIHEVVLFEANNYLGGHTATIDISLNNNTYAVDTGFIVYNEKTYPNFCKLLKKFRVKTQPTEMSFSYRSTHNTFEYNGHNLNTLFADRANLLKPTFYRFIGDILKFNRDAARFLKYDNSTISMEEFISRHHYNPLFINSYLIPIIASIWTKRTTNVLRCQARFLLDFFKRHGLINVINRPQWYTISGGSKSYIPHLMGHMENQIFLNTKVSQIDRQGDNVKIKTNHGEQVFDAVVIATHSDQALSMLSSPTNEEQKILGSIPYESCEAILHTDANILPKRKLAWASWNYLDTGNDQLSLSYYMNRLQRIKSKDPIILSVNLSSSITTDKILRKFTYAHPVFNRDGIEAQKHHSHVSGKNRTYFCGAYWGSGFHEDGVKSAFDVCRQLGVLE